MIYEGVQIIEAGGDIYLHQGEVGDEIVMVRNIDELLECERDNVQKIIAGEEL